MLFSTDSSNGHSDFGPNHTEIASDYVWDAEASMESWAIESLPWSESLPALSQTTLADTNLEEQITDNADELCYGMVSDSDVTGLSLLDSF